jgi:hypothetical protein
LNKAALSWLENSRKNISMNFIRKLSRSSIYFRYSPSPHPQSLTKQIKHKIHGFPLEVSCNKRIILYKYFTVISTLPTWKIQTFFASVERKTFPRHCFIFQFMFCPSLFILCRRHGQKRRKIIYLIIPTTMLCHFSFNKNGILLCC